MLRDASQVAVGRAIPVHRGHLVKRFRHRAAAPPCPWLRRGLGGGFTLPQLGRHQTPTSVQALAPATTAPAAGLVPTEAPAVGTTPALTTEHIRRCELPPSLRRIQSLWLSSCAGVHGGGELAREGRRRWHTHTARAKRVDKSSCGQEQLARESRRWHTHTARR